LGAGGGGGVGGGAALGAGFGAVADTVALPVLFDELCEGPHIATHRTMNVMTAAGIPNRISRRRFTGVPVAAGIETSPIVRIA
jgi:hypothetical protein